MIGESSLPSRPPLWQIGLAGIAFVTIAFAVYGSSLPDKFVAWDDTSLIFSQPVIRAVSLANLKHAFSMYDPELYIPLTFVSYQIDYSIGQLHPAVYHTTNLLLHTVSSLLVCWLAYLLIRNRLLAVLCGLFFLVHPLHTEAVSWASARKDVLPTPFFLLSIICYLYYRRGRGDTPVGRLYSLSLFFFLLSLFGKVVVLTLPLVLVLLDFLERRTWSTNVVIEKIPYFLLSVTFGVVAMFGKRVVVASSTPWEKFLMAWKSTLFYVEKFFVPAHLSVIYPQNTAITISAPEFFVPIILILGLSLLALWTLKCTRVVLVCWAFFLLNLAPSFVNIAKGGDIYFASDRYAYIASIGLILLIGFALQWLIGRSAMTASERTITRGIALGSAVTVVVLAVAANTQAAVWQDTITLLSHATDLYPDAYPAHINLAIALREDGKIDEAMAHLKAAQAIHDSVDVHINFAAVAKKQGEFAKAEDEYERAMAIDPKRADPLFGLGILYAEEGRSDLAIQTYEQALALEPEYTAVYNNLGSLYMDRGDYAKAEQLFRRSVQANAYFKDGYYNLGVALEQENKFDEAIGAYQQSLALDPENIDALVSLAGVDLRVGHNSDALTTIKRVLAIDPEDDAAKALIKEMVRMGIVGRKAEK